MRFLLSLYDICLWLAVTTIILLLTSELLIHWPLLSIRIIIDNRRLQLAAIGCGLGFSVAVAMQILFRIF